MYHMYIPNTQILDTRYQIPWPDTRCQIPDLDLDTHGQIPDATYIPDLDTQMPMAMGRYQIPRYKCPN